MTREAENPLVAAFYAVDVHPDARRVLDKIAARFARIDRGTGCVFLMGARFADQRPKIMVSGVRRTVARVLVAILHGKEIRSRSWEARHTCGNAACVAPAHLAPGDAAGNAADRDLHGRTARGERNGDSRLTRGQAETVLTDSRSVQEVAAELGVTPNAVRMIKRRQRWAHLHQPQHIDAT